MRRNAYTCHTCGATIFTEEIDQGTTPFTMRCRGTEGCEGEMRSHCYMVTFKGPAQFVWRKPTAVEYTEANRAAQWYYNQGGLGLYRIDNRSPEDIPCW